MINIKNTETRAISLSSGNGIRKIEVPPLNLNALSTERLTPVKYQQNTSSSGHTAGFSPQYQTPQNVRQAPTASQPQRQTPPQSAQQMQRQNQQNISQAQPAPPGQAHPAASPPPARPVQSRSPLQPPEKLLNKGEKYSITRNHPSSLSFCVGFGWDFSGPVNYDVDIEAFLLNETEKVPDDSWIVFYGQLRSPDGSVVHRGDSSDGKSFGADCEQINVNLRTIDKQITKIAFVMTINEAKLHNYNFSGIKDAYIRFTDTSTGKEIFRYELNTYYREVVSMVIGELYFRNGEWRFNPVGMGTGDDLEGLCNRYGIEVK